MTHLGVEFRDRFRCQRVLATLGPIVPLDRIDRGAVGQIPFPEAMGSDDSQRIVPPGVSERKARAV